MVESLPCIYKAVHNNNWTSILQCVSKEEVSPVLREASLPAYADHSSASVKVAFLPPFRAFSRNTSARLL